MSKALKTLPRRRGIRPSTPRTVEEKKITKVFLASCNFYYDEWSVEFKFLVFFAWAEAKKRKESAMEPMWTLYNHKILFSATLEELKKALGGGNWDYELETAGDGEIVTSADQVEDLLDKLTSAGIACHAELLEDCEK